METVAKAAVPPPSILKELNLPPLPAALVKLAIVIPCFNEEAVLRTTIARLSIIREQLLNEGLIHPNSQITFVDDGSTDRSWQLIELAARQASYIHGIKLSGNKGQQNALLAALFHVKGDAVITLDADLQDDVGAIREMVIRHIAGAHIVYGVRSCRDTDSVLKRVSSESFYRIVRWMGVDIVFNHAEFRLLSRAAINALRQYREVNLFLRGIIPMLGFRQEIVYYERGARVAGVTKYSPAKLVALAWEALSSFSAAPLRCVTLVGLALLAGSLMASGWLLAAALIGGRSLPDWAATLLPFALIAGLQVLSTGIVGEYIAKIYSEVKRRPRYIIEKSI